jgi:hypothetical protein
MKESFVNVAGDFNVLDTKDEAWGPLPESNTIQLEVNVPSSRPLSLMPPKCRSISQSALERTSGAEFTTLHWCLGWAKHFGEKSIEDVLVM